MRCSFLLLLPLLMGSAPPVHAGEADEGATARAGMRPALFLDSGALVGGEGRLETYQRSLFRIYTEGGVEMRRARSAGAAGRAAGLAVFFAPGAGDVRFGGGIRLSHDLDERWALQGMTGLLASSREEESGLFERGVHVRTSLVYRDNLSLGLIWEMLPYHLRDSGVVIEEGRHHSLHAVGMLHRGPGAKLSAAIVSIYVILAFAFIASGGAY